MIATWRKLTFRALTVTFKYLIWNKEFSRTRLLHNVLATFTRCRSSFWIMLLFPAILVTLTWYVTRFSWRNQWCIFNYSSPFRFTVSTLYQRRILETSGRRQSTVAVPFWSSSAATHSKLNLKIIFMNGQSKNRLSTTEDLLSIVTAAEILIRWQVTWHIQTYHVTIYQREIATEINIRKTVVQKWYF